MKLRLCLLRPCKDCSVVKPQVHWEWMFATCSSHSVTVVSLGQTHPFLNTSCVGLSRLLQLSGSLSQQFTVTTQVPTTTRAPDRRDIDLFTCAYGPGANVRTFVEEWRDHQVTFAPTDLQLSLYSVVSVQLHTCQAPFAADQWAPSTVKQTELLTCHLRIQAVYLSLKEGTEHLSFHSVIPVMSICLK